MCNSYESRFNFTELKVAFDERELPIVAAPDVAADGARRPTDPAPIVRAVSGGVEVVEARWGLHFANVKGPVTNRRADDRRFDAGRCLVPAVAFHEWTGTHSPKTKWRFTVAADPWFCFAGLWRTAPGGDQRFAVITIEPGPDVAPYHDRQPAILHRRDWCRWLDTDPVPPGWLVPLPPGSITVDRVRTDRDDGQLRLL